MKGKSLEGVKASLVFRILWMDEQAPGVFTVNDGVRDIDRQWVEWRRWQADIKKHGSRDAAIKAGCAIAAYPGTSKHGRKPGEAVDLGCAREHDALRARLVREAGCHTPIPSEPWHIEELVGAPLPRLDPPTPVPPPVTSQESDEMPKYTDQHVWPNGARVQVFPDGRTECFGAQSWGSMFSFRDDAKLSFKEAHAVGPIDPADCNAGYIIYDQSGNGFRRGPKEPKKYDK